MSMSLAQRPVATSATVRRRARWPLWGILAGCLAGGAAGLTPLSLLVVLAGGLAILVATAPTAALLVALPAILFGRSLSQYPGLGWAQHIDEAAVLALLLAFLLRAAVLRRPVRFPAGLGWIGGVVAAGLVSGIVAGVPVSVMGQSALLSAKGWLLALVVAQADWTPVNRRRLVQLGAAVTGFVFAACAVNAVAPRAWTAITGAGGQLQYRSALPVLVGPFVHPEIFGGVLCLAAGALAAAAVAARTAYPRLVPVLASAAAVAGVWTLLSARRMAIVALLLAVLVLLAVRRSAAVWALLVAALPFALTSLYPTVSRVWQATATQYFSPDGQAARTLLTLDSLTLAHTHFPLGVGLGRYGSAVAGQVYSPVYYELGLDKVYGLAPTPPNNSFLTDTFWPSVLGESGWLGLVLYLLAVVAVLRLALALYRRGSAAGQVVGLMTVVVWTQTLPLSIGNPVYADAQQGLIPFVLLGLAAWFASTDQAMRRTGAARDVGPSSDPMSPSGAAP